MQIPAGLVLQSLNTVNNYLSNPKLAAALPTAPTSLSLSPLSPFLSLSLLLSLIFPLSFPDSGLNRMLILTGGFQSWGSSFSSWCAPQVHQHKVILLFKKEVIFPSCMFFFHSSLSLCFLCVFCLVSKKTQNTRLWEKQCFKVIVTAIEIHLTQVILRNQWDQHFV